MSLSLQTPANRTETPPRSLRCDCGEKKAAELHPRYGLVIRFGHGARRKHQATLTPRQLLALLSGADTPEEQLAYVRRLLRREPPADAQPRPSVG